MRLFGEFPKKVASSRAESRTDSEPTRCAVRVLELQQSTGMIVVNVERGTVGGIECEVVDGRELHKKLGNKAEFSNWMKQRIHQLNFVENQDFGIYDKVVVNSGRGRPPKEYTLTLKMAKKIAMAEHTDEGNAVRDYFLDRERISYEAPRRATALNDVDIASIVSDVVACIPRVPRTFKNPVTQTPTVAVSSRLRR